MFVKHICKKITEPENFSRWKKRNKGAGWGGFFKTSEHGELRKCLVEEQLEMCCYCEVMISPEDSHIEHLRPKGIPLYRKDMFLYENLLASCNKKDSCGRLKGRWYEAEMVSPLDENCEKRLTEKALSGTEKCTHIPTLLIIN
ncbi:MAG TPA: TIGR02646 family protein [Desulfobacterales bacterium]|nr:TIGR02646 family protein [Desulfobacterales bacterium]